MLILKSFIHKKTTKIYICLLSILFLILLLISSFRSYYSQLLQLEYDINNIYYITINKKDIDKVYNSKFIKEPVIGLNLIYNNNLNFFTGYDDNLASNEIIVKSDYFFDNNITIENEYFISDIYYKNIANYDSVISYSLYQEISSLSSEITIQFLLNKRKYSEILEEELKNTFGYDINLICNYGEEFNTNLNTIIFYIDFFVIILLLSALVLTIVINVNVLLDERKVNTLYKYLGFNFYKTILYNIIKLYFLFLTSILISFILFCIMICGINSLTNLKLNISFEILVIINLFVFLFTLFYIIIKNLQTNNI